MPEAYHKINFFALSYRIGLSLTALLPAAVWYIIFIVCRFLHPLGQKTTHKLLNPTAKRKSYRTFAVGFGGGFAAPEILHFADAGRQNRSASAKWDFLEGLRLSKPPACLNTIEKMNCVAAR